MAPCDASTSSSSGSNAFDTFLISFPNATSAPPPPLCAPTFPVSSVTFISTVAGFVTIILATGLIVYIFYKRGWFYQTDPDPEGAARLRALRESANIAKGLDPAVICSFPVYTFSDKSVKREVTTETNVLASLRQYSCEVKLLALQPVESAKSFRSLAAPPGKKTAAPADDQREKAHAKSW
ncbi:hypothetical protein CLOP_g19762 [Closterium sp. NIES-67]|nr:hypothetical protein CLOP_g19762 [Closterium sp. NIES-67]